MKVRFAAFMAVVLYNGYSGLLMSQMFVGNDERFRLVTVAFDGLMAFMAVTVLFRNRNFYGVRFIALFLLAATITVIYNLDKIGFIS